VQSQKSQLGMYRSLSQSAWLTQPAQPCLKSALNLYAIELLSSFTFVFITNMITFLFQVNQI